MVVQAPAAAAMAVQGAAAPAADVAGPVVPAVVPQVIVAVDVAQACASAEWCTKWRPPFFQINSLHSQSCCITGEYCRKDIYSAWHS